MGGDYVPASELVSLARLRADHPTWVWRVQRDIGGFRWTYTGERDGRTIRLRAYSALLHRYDGDESYTTVWYVEEGSVQRCYSAFTVQEAVR